ncbi:SNARE associated Golgi protein family [Abeliophyllum distichum]|uniref:SNARE associated Golgi protein family n=1 Tax=Abeliophyllum distichum TaxID=126358 RepID=A0ABD1UJC1_9LAMI
MEANETPRTRLRHYHEEGPLYGKESPYFTMKIHHGCIMFTKPNNLVYEHGDVDYMDYVHSSSLNRDVLDKLVEGVGVLTAVVFKWVGPFFMDKEIIPMIHWEMETFSTQVLALLVFGSVALFPIVLLPSTPSMWVAGMTFGYGYGFLLTIGAVAIGVSLPYFIGFLFHHKIQMWLERYPKKASIIRLAGMVPEVFVALYTGILIKTLADASHDQHSLSASQIIFNTLGFCITVATTVIITLYAKKRLKELQRDDHLLLQ